ncbi:hypothetical protein DENSPDRAFT_844054 [Dentipellis sp. KUC8613]|nr:hypothetical protein DENSPDRAFT_844054 [Dentipellis sp. KUC8613]
MSNTSCLQEYVYDEGGNLIPDVATGYRLTPRCLETRRQRRILKAKGRAPMDELPSELRAYPNDSRRPDRMQYGIPVTTSQLYKYATRRKLPVMSPFGTPSHRADFMTDLAMKVVADLREVCNARLEWVAPVSIDYDWMLAFYDNYNWYREELEDHEEQEVVEILQKELRTNERPKWYWDMLPF